MFIYVYMLSNFKIKKIYIIPSKDIDSWSENASFPPCSLYVKCSKYHICFENNPAREESISTGFKDTTSFPKIPVN